MELLTPENPIDLLIYEKARNANKDLRIGGRKVLTQHLSKQAPNLIYFNESGEIATVLMFRVEHSFQAYISRCRFDADGILHPRKSETVTTRTPEDLETFISRTLSPHGMAYELMGKPSLVYRYQPTEGCDPRYVHIGIIKDKAVLGCQYFIGSIGIPRIEDLTTETCDLPLPEFRKLEILRSVPDKVSAYTRRFSP